MELAILGVFLLVAPAVAVFIWLLAALVEIWPSVVFTVLLILLCTVVGLA